ncbi:hypothetical protein COV16_03445 [Candidatus Woesearchaeota archaeon CG10_big_fil_rev_8_21_14_0_10_34_8]|nr:MAG: hypothetical protein COV16_03445 [Candidatus Woesearchaeota archaeon CG10_big_fil_rev_8_21_14_0_10_34_8]
MKYIIEHIDPEIYDWSLMEYKHISKVVGKLNVIFTNIKNNKDKLRALGRVEEKQIKELKLKNACLLDPKAEKTLNPKDNFDYLIFGGILGDDPPQGRTEKAFTGLKCEKRNLGSVQMSTNTAVLVAKMIVDGRKFEEIKFVDELVIPVQEGEEIILPYRFVVKNGKPVLADGYVEFVKENEFH